MRQSFGGQTPSSVKSRFFIKQIKNGSLFLSANCSRLCGIKLLVLSVTAVTPDCSTAAHTMTDFSLAEEPASLIFLSERSVLTTQLILKGIFGELSL